MAKKEETTSKVVMERAYIIPLSRELLKVPHYRKAKKAVRTVQGFIRKHMKSEDVRMGRYLNMKLWEHGIRNPPKKVKVNASLDEQGTVRVELFDAPKEEKKESKKKTPVKTPPTTKEEKKVEKAVEEKKKETKAKQEEAAKTEKEDVKELKKELSDKPAPKEAAQPKKVEAKPPAPDSKK